MPPGGSELLMAFDFKQASLLLPHGPGMRLIDHVDLVEEQRILCRTASHLRAANPLLQKGAMPLMALVEYAAQTAGLHLGLMQQAKGKNAPAVGFIGGLKDVEFLVPDLPMTEWILEAELLIQDKQSAIYRFKITAGSITMAAGRITLTQ